MASADGAESDVSLPDSVHSSNDDCDLAAEADNASDAVSLPEDVLDDTPEDSDACCKKGNCKAKFKQSDLDEYQLQFTDCGQELRLKKVFDKVRDVFKAGGSDPKKVMPWTVMKQPVCRRFFESVHGVGHGSLDKLVAYAKNGHMDLPGRAPRLQREAPASATVDTWFVTIYRDLAEPLALPGSGDIAEASSEDMVQHEVIASDHPLAALSMNLRQSRGDPDPHGRVYAPKRYLNFGSEQQLFQFYQEDEDSGSQVSRSTFKKAWAKWQKFLPLKNSGEGSKCNTCADLTLQRAEATEPSDRIRIDGLKQQHLQTVMADRSYSVRCNKAASRPDVWLKSKNQSLFCKLEIDGMDQSKFAIPRMKQMAGTSSYAKCWRPAIHVTGALLFGQIEYYAVMSPDLAKDSNMNATVTCRVLELMQEKLDTLGHDQFGFPGELVVMCDNTPREAKNSYFGAFLASMVSRSLFNGTECHFLQVDHTHNELDQRFSTLSSHIKQAEVIEDISDLVSYLKANVNAAANRTLVIEELKATMDFKQFLSSMNLHLTGLTTTHLQPHVNHMWRFAPRLSVDQAHYGTIECHHPDWTSLQEHPSDVVLILKQFLSSPAHSQAPQLVLPLKVAEGLTGKLQPAPRNKFSDTTLTEFRKSASVFGERPWNLLKAKYFLEELCDTNEKEEPPPALDLKFYFSAGECLTLMESSDPNIPDEDALDERQEHGAPRRVIAGRRAPKGKAKAKPAVKAAVKVAAAPARKRPAAAINPHHPGPNPEPEDGPVMKRPASQAEANRQGADQDPAASEWPTNFEHGCSKCRKHQYGCKRCKAFAAANKNGWKYLSNGMVVRDLDHEFGWFVSPCPFHRLFGIWPAARPGAKMTCFWAASLLDCPCFTVSLLTFCSCVFLSYHPCSLRLSVQVCSFMRFLMLSEHRDQKRKSNSHFTHRGQVSYN